jgi:plasmid stabilization system protein ParE
MSYSIKLLPIAYKDLQEAKQWYNEKRENLGEEFKKAVIAEIDYIKAYPEHYQQKYKELRQSLVTRFPYAIFYLIEESNKRIIIFGVLHTSRNPELLQERTK